MLLWQRGVIIEVIQDLENKQMVHVKSENNEIRLAINYPKLTGTCMEGDIVLFNSTSVELGLGTGGYDFIIANTTNPPISREVTNEHIIKNRYTPLQYAIQSGEENDDELLIGKNGLSGVNVFIIALHSMLPLLALTIKNSKALSRIIYVMTDSSSLPIWLSDHVDQLLEQKWLEGTITTGQSFGGNIEAINKFSGLLLARHKYEADFIIIGPGPGSVGTGTEWGYSAIEVGEIVNAVNILNGIPIVVPRISFSDKRYRHIGMSHHILTALSKVALTKAILPIPKFDDYHLNYIQRQLLNMNIEQKHQVVWVEPSPVEEIELLLSKSNNKITSMGRGFKDDPFYFQGVIGAAQYALTL